MAVDKYRLYCETEQTHVYVIADHVPTECPNDILHSIKPLSICIEAANVEVNDGTIKSLSLDNYKHLRYHEIDRHTQELIEEGFVFDGVIFSSSLSAQTNWNTIKDNEEEFEWPLAISTIDDVEYVLAQEDLRQFWLSAKDTIKWCLDTGRALKVAIHDATTEAEVDAILDER